MEPEDAEYQIRTFEREGGFSDLVDFVQHQCELVSNPEYSREAFLQSKGDTPSAKVKNFFVGKDLPPCYLCSLLNQFSIGNRSVNHLRI